MIKGFIDIYEDEKKELEKLEAELNKFIKENNNSTDIEDAKKPIYILNEMEEHYLNMLKVLNVSLDMLNTTRDTFTRSIKIIDVEGDDK